MNICPRCRESELLAPGGEHDARACTRCRGVWLASGAARRIVEVSVGPLDGLPVVPVGSAVLRCPDCQGELVRRRAVVVDIDACVAHGVWFDHREIERIRAAGGHESGAALAVGAVVVGAVATTLSPSQEGQQPASDPVYVDSAIDGAEVVLTTVCELDAVEGIAVVGEVAGAGVEVAGFFEFLAGLFEGL